mgnify:CR=1 FL=1|tara:strand:+ start:7949 stop:8341 length:393 start_codon:yes stop_codon:yes gene_type:complete
MKKSELKNIIKECVKEVIFEDGVLSGIITEVAQGLTSAPLVQESKTKTNSSNRNSVSDSKKRVLSAIGDTGYDDLKKKFKNPGLFEGTSPIPEGNGSSALSGVAPGDAGVDISNIPGMGSWAAVASKQRK